MAKFKIIHTYKLPNSTEAIFEIEYISGNLEIHDTFITYDTHHPVKWVVIESKEELSRRLLRCKTSVIGIAWDDQFANTIVDNLAIHRNESYVRLTRPQVERLAGLGPLPSESSNSINKIEEYDFLLKSIDAPVTDEEAVILSKLFGTDSCFGLAWTILHLIESSPNWPIKETLTDKSNDWILRLRQRAGIED